MAPRDFVDSSIGTMDFGERGRSVRGAGGTGTTVGAPSNTSVQDIEDQVRYTVNIPNDDGGSETQQLTRKQIEQSLGMTDSNPYGLMSGIGRLLGTENVSYPGLMGTPAFGAVKDLMVRRYLAPVDTRTGRVEPGLRAGDPVLARQADNTFIPSTVQREPSLQNRGLASFIPGAGLLTGLFDTSDLVVPDAPSSMARYTESGIFDFEVPENAFDDLPEPASVQSSPFSPERQAAFQAGLDEITANADMILAENAAKRQLAGMPDGLTTFAEIPPAIPEPRIRDFQIQPTGTTFNEPINPPIRTELNVTRTGAAPDMASLSPLPEPSLPYLPTLEDEFSQQARQELVEAERRRGDRLDFKLDMLEAQPKAFEPRAPLPPPPPPPLPPLFNEQVALADPATYGLTGFRP